ncbi:7d519cfd-6318-4743-8fe4-fdcebdff523b [Sclerotinia trifoliorum]|uniref:7d519cfd-6318-4743-8fe4-fdcebdff523b n=1 Tax=Sclerotinia trifoliorum TaxID=28548 RepID=A0A8H2ZLA5_9HELO|nr:7d519cfd-6318-4743-8fe4-fdcebdff523b [Sclerotinia trifoliorum]
MPVVPVLPSIHRQVFNGILCVVTFFIIFRYFRRLVTFAPITIESLWQISLAEINRRKNVARVKQLEQKLSLEDAEKGIQTKDDVAARCIASVVGYREEANMWRRCLQSYHKSPGLEIMLIGIDGDHDGDMEMVSVAQQVFPDVTKIHVEEPYGPLAVRIAQNYITRELYDEKTSSSKWTSASASTFASFDSADVPKALLSEAYSYAFRIILEKAATTLREHNALLPSSDSKSKALHAICLYQPHKCKKDIMFTNMVFSLALGQANNIEYLWTSDSDTIVYPDTLYQTVGCMSADPLIGGSCSALSIHNDNESAIAALGSATYWSELAITRGQTGAVDAVDCQPGPCAAFRFIALEPILLPWYTQTSIGVKTVVNEDRHLTTNLLLRNWKVTFNTSALASTDTPTTLLRWLLQQMRWARATHIECFQYPQIYTIHGVILFVTAMRRFYGPLIIGVFTIRYVFTGFTVHALQSWDFLLRVVLCTGYNFWRNKSHVGSIKYLVLSQLFYQLPLPGIMFWSVLTVLEGGWGTGMRNADEQKKSRYAGWDNLWSTTAVVIWMGFVAAAVARWVISYVAPAFLVEAMIFAGATSVGSLYWTLLG